MRAAGLDDRSGGRHLVIAASATESRHLVGVTPVAPSEDKQVVRVAGAQMPVRDLRRNELAILRAIDRAAAAGAAILLTPEGSLSGYTPDFDPAAVEAALGRVTSAAAAVGLGLALGTCFIEADGRCYNQLRFYAGDGTYLGFHAKILLCGTRDTASTGTNEFERYTTRELRTFSFGGITIAGLLCNDLWATPGATPDSDPYLVREAVRLGARIIFHGVNGGRTADKKWDLVRTFHESNVRMRAWWFRVPIVTVDSAEPLTQRCSAPGGVVNEDGEWLVRTPWRGEHVFVTDVAVGA